MDIKNLSGKKVTVLGAARSGIAAAELLKKNNVAVFVSDRDDSENKQKEIKKLKKVGIPCETGGHTDLIYECDFMVLSPGIPVRLPVVQRFYQKNIPVFSEVEVAAWFCQSPIIAVTGSNGKTTTTNLAGEMMRKKYADTIIAGNIGTPFSGQVENSRKESCAVVEVSSFQLETIDKFKPHVAVILNLAPNHLDRYDSYEDYILAKMRIIKNSGKKDHIIYNYDDSELSGRVSKQRLIKHDFSAHDETASAFIRGGEIFIEGEKVISTEDFRLQGEHNHMNFMAAALAVKRFGLHSEKMRKVGSEFRGVEHRLEFVSNVGGIDFINDSKATTIESLAVALKSFRNPVILIAGGKDKGSDFNKLNDLVKKHVKEIILIGISADKIEQSWQELKPIMRGKTMQEAVRIAYQKAENGDTVLLSPACASFDMFNDYEHRGRVFKECVYGLK